MKPTEAPQARALIDSGRLLWLGMTLLVGVALLTAAYAARQRQTVIADETRRMDTLVRVLQGETQRLLDTSALMLQTLASRIDRQPAGETDALRESMLATLRIAPQMRSLWLIDTEGRILAATHAPQDLRPLDTGRLTLASEAGEIRLGGWLPGRDLRQSGVPPAGVGVMTLSTRIAAAEVGPARPPARHLIATLNPDALAS